MANDAEAIVVEISYNFAITGNYMAYNGWAIGLTNPKFPTPAIYISESGSVPGPGGSPRPAASRPAPGSRRIPAGR